MSYQSDHHLCECHISQNNICASALSVRLFYSADFSSFTLRLPRLRKRELILVFFMFARFLLVWFCLSSSSWCLGRAAACVCGTSWTFLLPSSYYKPASVAQLDARSTGDQKVAGSNSAVSATFIREELILKYFLRSFPSADSPRAVLCFWR